MWGTLEATVVGLPEGRTTFEPFPGTLGALVGYRVGGERIGIEAVGGVSLDMRDELRMEFPVPAQDATFPVQYELTPGDDGAWATFTLYGGRTYSSQVEGSVGWIRLNELSASEVLGEFEFNLKQQDGSASLQFTNGGFHVPLTEDRLPTPTPSSTPSPS